MQHSNASAVCAKIQGSPSWHECPCGAFVLTRQGQLAHVGPLTVSCLIYLVQITRTLDDDVGVDVFAPREGTSSTKAN
jgi:hypothetical protein